jgi:small-conductance mechanosensitive channel
MHSIFKKRERIILYIAIAVIFFSLLFNFLLSPVIEKYDILNKKINLNQAKLQKYQALLNSKNEIENKYAKLSLSSEPLKDMTDPTVASLAALENLAKNADIKLLDIRPEQNQKKNNQNTIELRAEGSMEGYTKFIYNIGNSLMLLKIRRFQIAAKPNAQSLEGTFTIIQSNNAK